MDMILTAAPVNPPRQRIQQDMMICASSSNHAALGLAYGVGLRVSEVAYLMIIGI
jgi:hypothetical protein